MPVRGKYAASTEDCPHPSSEADKAAFASGTHLPQQVPTPRFRVRSRMLAAPFFTADRMCLSDTALQTQMIMGVL